VTREALAKPAEESATIELREASFRRAGAAVGATLSLRSTARRVGLVGAWGPFFRSLTGEANVASGTATISGCALHLALARGVVGFAPCDPPLPASFTVREYLEHGARLSHGSRARAAADARRILDEYGLSALSARKLGQLATYQRRALGIALAALTAPPVLCLEAPLRDLDAVSADYVARLCWHAAEQSRVIVSLAVPSTPSAERALLDECDELFLLERGALVAQGRPEAVFSPSARYFVTLAGSRDRELQAALTRAGCQLTQQPSPTAFGALLTPGRRVTRYLIELPPGASSNLLLDAALDTGETLLELEPVFASPALA
jgi:ABC-type multidrug transport system ATPase subunit